MVNLIKGLWRDPWQPGFMLALAVINLAGSVYGYFWYKNQLAATPVYFWPVVPDSPLSTTLFALAMVAALLGWRFAVLRLVAFTTCIKYGFWAVVLNSHNWIFYGGFDALGLMLWLSHLGMTVQGLWFLRKTPVPVHAMLIAVLWMVINDAMDYILNLHPYLFVQDQWTFAVVAAVLLTVVLSAYLVNRAKRHRIWGIL